jgi:hypothetical protein
VDDAAGLNGIVDNPCEGKAEVDTKEEGFVDSDNEVPVDVLVDFVALDLLGLSP